MTVKTRALDLSFVVRTSPWRRLLPVLLGLGLALACLDTWLRISRLDQALAVQEAQAEEIRFLLERHARSKQIAQSAPDKSLADIQQRLSISWRGLLHTLDLATSTKVQLLSLTPDPTSRRLRLIIEAESLAAVLQYVDVLEASAMLSHVHPLNQQAPSANTVGMPLNTQASPKMRFTLQADWEQQP